MLLIRPNPAHTDHHFDVEEGDERRKRISESPHSGTSEVIDEKEPYDCISNPAPWHHQLTVRS